MKNNRFMNVLLKAKEENIAVGAVNIFNYLTAEAAVKAAEEIGVNLIIQTSAGTVEHFGAQKLYDIVDAARKGAKIEVALHLDHCHLSCICDIFFKWQMRKVHHNAVPSSICAKLSKFFITAVIKM